METILSASNLDDVKDPTDLFVLCHPAYVGETMYLYVDVKIEGR